VKTRLQQTTTAKLVTIVHRILLTAVFKTTRQSVTHGINDSKHYGEVAVTGALKMHDLKMTDKENYGSGKCKSGK